MRQSLKTYTTEQPIMSMMMIYEVNVVIQVHLKYVLDFSFSVNTSVEQKNEDQDDDSEVGFRLSLMKIISCATW